MPDFQTFLGEANIRFSAAGIGGVPSELFNGELTLGQIAQELEFAAAHDVSSIDELFPDELQAALIGLIRRNLSGERKPITFAGIPGQGNELRIYLIGPCMTVLLHLEALDGFVR